MAKEIEAKFLNIDKDALRATLRAGGFQLIDPEYLMRRKTFDCSLVFPERKMWGRVRREAGRVTMTLKEIIGEGINGMQEIELTVDDFETACAFMQCAGMPIKSSQENTRELWRRADVEVALDTWPGLKPFVEIEAAAEADVRAVSAELGFDFRDALFGGVDIVYERELGIPANLSPKAPRAQRGPGSRLRLGRDDMHFVLNYKWCVIPDASAARTRYAFDGGACAPGPSFARVTPGSRLSAPPRPG